MKRFGLALSGGGFRASLYHLGLVRFLRDAGILPQVSHITSVSGGSILAAHMVLNWDRYTGSESDFDAAAAEFISFVRLDVRNRILRRFPLNLPLRGPRRLLGLSNRKLTRTGLLEAHYERFLYGETSLFQLPERPQLHILATNLSEGCLCSFHRDGLLLVRRQPGTAYRMDRIHAGLATVAMAVTASSAFPGFFPPLELTGADVGANGGEFGRQSYTDGGVYDNLGVRMFRCLGRPLLSGTPLTPEDFVDLTAAAAVLRASAGSADDTPLRRLGQLVTANGKRSDARLLSGPRSSSVRASKSLARASASDASAALAASVWDVLCHYRLQHEPYFADLRLPDAEADSLLQDSILGERQLSPEDQTWLNRHLFEAAYRQATGNPCFHRLSSALDCILVSDVGKPFEVKSNLRAQGVIMTALRATEIVMDRVWQLEMETFHDAPGFVFAAVTDVVEPDEDPTAVHPEIQRQLPLIRTDLDVFSMLEISNLTRHGYCVGRKACRARPDHFGAALPGNMPWDPTPGLREPDGLVSVLARASGLLFKNAVRKAAAPEVHDARALQASAVRHIWHSFLDFKDWVTYLYVPILAALLIVTPYAAIKTYRRAQRVSRIVESLSQSSRDLEQMTRLLDGPITSLAGQTAEEVPTLAEPDLAGFEILQDIRILDLRSWNPKSSGKFDAQSMVYGYQRLKVVRSPQSPKNKEFRLQILATSQRTHVRLPPQQLPGKLVMAKLGEPGSDQKEARWEARFDMQRLPVGDYADLVIEYLAPGQFLNRGDGFTTLTFETQADTAEMTRWLLLPSGNEYRSFRIVRFPTGKPDKVEAVRLVTEYLADDSTILAYKLLSVDAGFTYEVTWYYK